MKLVCIIVLFSVLVCVNGVNYMFGNKTGHDLVYREKIWYEAIPFKKRIHVFEYNNSPKPIQAVYCYDYQNSEASVNITEGGVDYDFVKIRLKSQRSYRLNYAIEIYA